jgi:AcrR family transcriptional regulator
VYSELMKAESSSRPYRKIERARKEEETRKRIVAAAVELHRTVGPAHTTIADVARLAGVTRMTVYNHFPTEVDLFVGCSTHWATKNPFPSPAGWADIEDSTKRLSYALNELYQWYGLKQDMLGKVFRDTPILPSLAEVMGNLWTPYVEELIATLAEGWPVQRDDAESLSRALRLVIDFNTWRSLSGSGVDDQSAAELAARMVISALGPGSR